MNINIVNDLIDWAKSNKREDFRDFILFINEIYEDKLIVNMSYYNLNLSGKLNRWNIFYNKKFSDFDFDISLDCYENTIILKKLTMENFKKATDKKFLILDYDNEKCELEIREGI